ncbi:unnamed protein product [Rhizopus stolonifer]
MWNQRYQNKDISNSSKGSSNSKMVGAIEQPVNEQQLNAPLLDLNDPPEGVIKANVFSIASTFNIVEASVKPTTEETFGLILTSLTTPKPMESSYTANPFTFKPMPQKQTENPFILKLIPHNQIENPFTFKSISQKQTANYFTAKPMLFNQRKKLTASRSMPIKQTVNSNAPITSKSKPVKQTNIPVGSPAHQSTTTMPKKSLSNLTTNSSYRIKLPDNRKTKPVLIDCTLNDLVSSKSDYTWKRIVPESSGNKVYSFEDLVEQEKKH